MNLTQKTIQRKIDELEPEDGDRATKLLKKRGKIRKWLAKASYHMTNWESKK